MTSPEHTVHEGLEGVLVTRTEIAEVDGERGLLIVRGHPIERLVGRLSFEGACALLWDGRLPSPARVSELRCELGLARRKAFERLHDAGHTLGMDALRAAVAALPSDADRASVLGTLAVTTTAWARAQRGL